ncbi:hypothetical protein KSS87_004510, partial [Heliosperma pusillum]
TKQVQFALPSSTSLFFSFTSTLIIIIIIIIIIFISFPFSSKNRQTQQHTQKNQINILQKKKKLFMHLNCLFPLQKISKKLSSFLLFLTTVNKFGGRF